MITLITPTGGRPEAFALCEKWIANQTYKEPFEWIVIDDVYPTTPITMGQRALRPMPYWEPGQNTQHRNLALASGLAEGDTIFVIEDDDYYAPNYIESMLAFLEISNAQMVGEAGARYYNLKERCYQRLQNSWHASLSQTVFKREALATFNDAISSGEKFIDIELWKRMQDNNIKVALRMTVDSGFVVGIKGMPGREGIGTGHKPEGYTSDPDCEILKQWLGDDFADYEPFLVNEVNSSEPTE